MPSALDQVTCHDAHPPCPHLASLPSSSSDGSPTSPSSAWQWPSHSPAHRTARPSAGSLPSPPLWSEQTPSVLSRTRSDQSVPVVCAQQPPRRGGFGLGHGSGCAVVCAQQPPRPRGSRGTEWHWSRLPPEARSARRSGGDGTRSPAALDITTASTWRSLSARPFGPWPPASCTPSARSPGTGSSSRSTTRERLEASTDGPSTHTSPRQTEGSSKASASDEVSPSARAAESPDGTASRPARTSTSRSATPRADRSIQAFSSALADAAHGGSMVPGK